MRKTVELGFGECFVYFGLQPESISSCSNLIFVTSQYSILNCSYNSVLFCRIYDLCMSNTGVLFSGMDQQQFPHLLELLGLAVAGTVELGHIVESPVIRTATSVVPLGWTGIPGEKNAEPLKVDITGFSLHLCNLVHAQVNGNW